MSTSARRWSTGFERALRLSCLAAIALGVVLRFDGLARRPLWYDEAATMLHLRGTTEAQIAAWYDGRPLRRTDLLAMPAPRGSTPLATVIRTIAADEPQIGPGYFVLAYAWTRLFGAELTTLRALSAVASVLALVLIHRLTRALFGERNLDDAHPDDAPHGMRTARPSARDMALAAAALAALSPLHLRYAQEARPYALWTALLLACALAIVRARAQPTRAAWLAYGSALVAALWVQPLTVLVIPAFVALALSPTKPPSSLASAPTSLSTTMAVAPRAARGFCAATGIAVLTGLVWAAVCWSQRATIARTTAWSSLPHDWTHLGRRWLGVLTSIFYRPTGEGGLVGVGGASVPVAGLAILLGLGATVLVAAALVAVAGAPRIASRRFVWWLALGPWAALAAADLLTGGRRSTIARYLVPAWLGVELAVAFFVMAVPGRARRYAMLHVLLALGLATALATRPLAAWWDTDAPRMHAITVAAAAIAVDPAALVVTDVAPLALLELTEQLPDATVVRLGLTAPAAIAADQWPHVVLFMPSDALVASARRALPASHRLVAHVDLPLWRAASADRGGS